MVKYLHISPRKLCLSRCLSFPLSFSSSLFRTCKSACICQGAQFDPIVLTHMKQELVKRGALHRCWLILQRPTNAVHHFDRLAACLAPAGGTLETPAICALLPVIDTVEDDLWKLLRPRALSAWLFGHALPLCLNGLSCILQLECHACPFW